MRYGRDYQGDWERGRGRGYGDSGYQGEWAAYDRSPFPERGYGFRDMQRYEENYRFNQGRGGYDRGFRQGGFQGGGYDRGFRQGGFEGGGYDRGFAGGGFQRGGYDRGYHFQDRPRYGRGVYDQGLRPSELGHGEAPFGPRSYGQGEMNRWTIPGNHPLSGPGTGMAMGYGMGRGRFI